MWTLLSALAAPEYTLSFPDREANLLTVEAELDATGDATELFMATWTPGSYLIREYARHIEGLEAIGSDGTALAITKTAKNRWVVDTQGTKRFTLTYRLWCRGMNVRANFVDAEFAMLNGAPTFIVPADLKGPYQVEVERPEDWAVTMTQNSPADRDRFQVPTYDLLVDAPIVVGNPSIQKFDVEGVEHVLVDIPAVSPWDSEKAAEAVKTQVEAQYAFWGSFPYERYLFLNVLGEQGGGLEHLDSTLMLTSRFNTQKKANFERWLGLVAHEHFHAWNVKRLRPVALGPFDYESEVYTPSLWIAEGFTSYYDDLLLVRSGLIDTDAWMARMSGNLERIADTPGRLEQPVSRASFDAWIKYYRKDANSVNTAISYYNKGAVIAWILDARIRNRTDHERSLDDAMRLAYERHSGDKGYTPEQFVAVLSEVAGEDLGPFVASMVDEAAELPVDEALAEFGLQLEDGPKPGADPAKGWAGMQTSGARITAVLRDGPAWRAGLNVDDEVLAVNGTRISSASQIGQHGRPGDSVTVLFARRGRVKKLALRLGDVPVKPSIGLDDGAKGKTRKRREAWWSTL